MPDYLPSAVTTRVALVLSDCGPLATTTASLAMPDYTSLRRYCSPCVDDVCDYVPSVIAIRAALELFGSIALTTVDIALAT